MWELSPVKQSHGLTALLKTIFSLSKIVEPRGVTWIAWDDLKVGKKHCLAYLFGMQ